MATIHTDWKSAIKGYKDYLALERGLSENSILAYMRDIKQFAKIIEKVDGARAHFSYITFNDKGEELNKAITTLVFVDAKKNRPMNPPEQLGDLLRSVTNIQG